MSSYHQRPTSEQVRIFTKLARFHHASKQTRLFFGLLRFVPPVVTSRFREGSKTGYKCVRYTVEVGGISEVDVAVRLVGTIIVH